MITILIHPWKVIVGKPQHYHPHPAGIPTQVYLEGIFPKLLTSFNQKELFLK